MVHTIFLKGGKIEDKVERAACKLDMKEKHGLSCIGIGVSSLHRATGSLSGALQGSFKGGLACCRLSHKRETVGQASTISANDTSIYA